jgi:hypothetical protein
MAETRICDGLMGGVTGRAHHIQRIMLGIQRIMLGE